MITVQLDREREAGDYVAVDSLTVTANTVGEVIMVFQDLEEAGFWREEQEDEKEDT